VTIEAAELTMQPVTPAHHDYLSAVAHTRPELWPRVCRDRVPSPSEFPDRLWADVVGLYVVVTSDLRPAGLVGMFNWQQVSGTVFCEMVAPGGGADGDLVEHALFTMLTRSWSSMRLRRAYLPATDFQRPPASNPYWVVEQQGELSDAIFWDGTYWDQGIYAISRTSS